MSNILNALRLRGLLILDAVLDLFDNGLDGAIAAFQKAERKLTTQQDRLDARIQREFDAQLTSYERQRAAEAAEYAVRSASRDRAATLAADRARAARIQSRIGELLK